MVAWFNGIFMEEKGTAAIEYAMLVSLIAVVVVGAVETVGTNLVALFTNIAASL
ncbi:MAG TPA: Flp family type IVb pilin [Stellaceae bacterium]|nr:Flp family type IVb pilin [Stellaceae bacterium]